MSFFSWLETGKRLIVLVYECLRGPFMVLLFSPVDSRWRECVAAAKKFGQRENKGVWRRRIYRKCASCRWLKNAGLEFTRGRSFKQVTWSSWPMVSRDWILSVRHLRGNKWHTAQNNLLECKVLYYYINLYFRGIVSLRKKKQRLQSTPTITQVSDSITCSIERKDDRKRKEEKKHYSRLCRAEERNTESGFLLKEKKVIFLGTWSIRKKRKMKDTGVNPYLARGKK